MALLNPVPNSVQQGDDAFAAQVCTAAPGEAAPMENPAIAVTPPTEDLSRALSHDGTTLRLMQREVGSEPNPRSFPSSQDCPCSRSDRLGSMNGFGSGMSKFSTMSQVARLFGRRHSWNTNESPHPSQSFRKCKSLKLAADATFIRATPLTTVMQNAGLILKPGFHKFGSAELYQCSKEVVQIQDFISHSWRDGRWSKFASLCLVYNGSAGLVASLIYCAIVLVVQRTIPIRLSWGTYKKVLAGQTHDMNEGGCLAFVGAPIVCLGFLYNWMRIRGAWEGIPNVFLDRLCIHQTDEDLKRRGILSIGGILKHSDRMVVLWSPAYFFRLWCMFEVAVWCHLDRMDKLVLVPLSKAMLVVAGASVVYLICIVTVFVHRLGQWQISTVFSLLMVLAPPAVHCLRALMRDLVALRHQLGNVSVTAAECFCCSVNHVCPDTKKEIQCDRELIMNTVKELYESMGDGEGSAAERFDNVVRKDFAQRIIQNIGGPDAMPMRWCLLIVAPMMWRSADIISARDLPSAAILRLVLTQFNFVLDFLLVVRVWFFIWVYLANSQSLFVVDYAVSCLGAWACLMLAIGFWAKTYFASQLPMAWPLVVNIFISSMLNLAIFWSEFPPSTDKRPHTQAFRYLWHRKRDSRNRRYRGNMHSLTSSTGDSSQGFDKIVIDSSADNEEAKTKQCQPCVKVHPSAEPTSMPAWTPSPYASGETSVTSGVTSDVGGSGGNSTQTGKSYLSPAMAAKARARGRPGEEPQPQFQPVVTSWMAAKDNEHILAAAANRRSSWFSPTSTSASYNSDPGATGMPR